MKKKPIYKSLYVQVIAAIILGILLGNFFPGTGEAMKPLGALLSSISRFSARSR